MRVAIWLEHPAESRPFVDHLVATVKDRWGVDIERLRESAAELAPGLERTLLELPNEPDAFRLALATLTAINMAERQQRWYPSVYDVAIDLRTGKPRRLRYVDEPRGLEIWASTRALFARGFGDCEDLACDRAADLILQGYKAYPELRHEGRDATGTDLWHIICCTPFGCEDPSAELGMGDESWNG